jgi:uncharacterized membrane protein
MFFAMMIMFFIFMRLTHGRRRHYAHLHYRRHWHHTHPFRAQLQAPFAAPPAPKLNAFEQLKKRYVDGDIDVEQYEDELDVLFQQREARKDVP